MDRIFDKTIDAFQTILQDHGPTMAIIFALFVLSGVLLMGFWIAHNRTYNAMMMLVNVLKTTLQEQMQVSAGHAIAARENSALAKVQADVLKDNNVNIKVIAEEAVAQSAILSSQSGILKDFGSDLKRVCKHEALLCQADKMQISVDQLEQLMDKVVEKQEAKRKAILVLPT